MTENPLIGALFAGRFQHPHLTRIYDCGSDEAGTLRAVGV